MKITLTQRLEKEDGQVFENSASAEIPGGLETHQAGLAGSVLGLTEPAIRVGESLLRSLNRPITRQQFKSPARGECQIPPLGWWCSRQVGHEGPCAAHPLAPIRTVGFPDAQTPS